MSKVSGIEWLSAKSRVFFAPNLRKNTKAPQRRSASIAKNIKSALSSTAKSSSKFKSKVEPM